MQNQSLKYTCSNCGEEHESWPALGFKSPHYYHVLTEAEKRDIAELTADTCIIQHNDQTDRFIRGVLVQSIKDANQGLDYGLWVSLSEKSFQDYIDNFDSDDHETTYFGWLCNDIPEYESTLSIKTTVHTRGNQRPLIVIQDDNDHNHPFITDYFEGITEAEAIKRINNMMTSLRS
ncbi:MAG: DUF2199 domain-containing protein [Saprospiraceae bacterium]|nr:DUF2199 domain-containing protein [Saprospiraceae bacterium]